MSLFWYNEIGGCMKNNDFNIDGSYKRLGFILLKTGELISFGYQNLYDVIENCGYEDIDETYHNSAMNKQLMHHPKLSHVREMIESDYGEELLYSPFFPNDKVISTLVTLYDVSIFKKVSIPTEEPVDLLLLRNGITKEEIKQLQKLWKQTTIFQRLKLCREYTEDGYIDYDSMEEYMKEKKPKRR